METVSVNIPLLKSMLSLATVIEAKDPYTGGHTWRVSRYARLLAESIGLSQDEVFIVHFGSLMHDIGKVSCIYRSSRTVKTVHAAQREEKKTLWSGLYLKCATWSVLRGSFFVTLLSIRGGVRYERAGQGWHPPGWDRGYAGAIPESGPAWR